MGFLAALGLGLFNKAKPYLLYIALGVVAVITVLALLSRVKEAGKLQERVETMKRTIDAVKEREDVRQEIAEEKRATGRSSGDILRDEWTRD